ESEPHLLAELADAVADWEAQARRPLTLIAESDRNQPDTVTPTARGGLGMDMQWPTTCTTACTPGSPASAPATTPTSAAPRRSGSCSSACSCTPAPGPASAGRCGAPLWIRAPPTTTPTPS